MFRETGATTSKSRTEVCRTGPVHNRFRHGGVYPEKLTNTLINVSPGRVNSVMTIRTGGQMHMCKYGRMNKPTQNTGPT